MNTINKQVKKLQDYDLAYLVELVEEKELLNLHLQPIINADNDQIYGYEVLSRWTSHPLFQHDSGYKVRNKIAMEILFKQINDFPEGRLFINCGLNNLNYITSYINEMTKKRELVIELDFGSNLYEIKSLLDSVENLNELEHVTFAIDDLGKYELDYRLYNYIKPAYLKVDICVANGIAVSKHKQARLEDYMYIAKDIGAKIIIEGIEQQEDAEYLLREHKDSLIQGFYYHTPKPYSNFKKKK